MTGIGYHQAEGSPSLSDPPNLTTTQRLKIPTSRHLPKTLHDVGDSEDRLGHLPRLLHDRVGRSRLELAQFVCVLAELFRMFPALLHGIKGEAVLADGNDACDDRDDLRDVLAKGEWGNQTADPVDDVLDCHYDGAGLSEQTSERGGE